LYAMGVELPDVSDHPNRVPFEGILTKIDVPSDTSPNGARGHQVVLTRQAAIQALPSLIGMGINYSDTYDTHNHRYKCGIITKAQIVENDIVIKGFVYGKDCPELVLRAQQRDLGMSYEIHGAHVHDMRETVWTLSNVTFTGAAVLARNKAAYKSTDFKLV